MAATRSTAAHVCHRWCSRHLKRSRWSWRSWMAITIRVNRTSRSAPRSANCCAPYPPVAAQADAVRRVTTVAHDRAAVRPDPERVATLVDASEQRRTPSNSPDSRRRFESSPTRHSTTPSKRSPTAYRPPPQQHGQRLEMTAGRTTPPPSSATSGSSGSNRYWILNAHLRHLVSWCVAPSVYAARADEQRNGAVLSTSNRCVQDGPWQAHLATHSCSDAPRDPDWGCRFRGMVPIADHRDHAEYHGMSERKRIKIEVWR